MTKSDVSFLLVMIASVVAFFAWKTQKRSWIPLRQSIPLDDEPDSQAPGLNAEIVVSPPMKALTARERRHEEIRMLAQGERCLYCSARAEHALPWAKFVRPSIGLAAITTGDLPRHWRVHTPVSQEMTPVLCSSHATIARSAVELRIARAHAEYVEFVSAQKETLHEFTMHGLDEIMRSEAERVRKGTSRGGMGGNGNS